MTLHKVLIVDDESTLLELYQVQLDAEFPIDTAESGEEALALARDNGPYAVVVADEHMSGMNGTELLKSFRESSPKTVRIMLTADSQQQVAVEALNEGHLFRFLNKPCPPDRLGQAIRAGLEQYRLVMAEKELLANTLNGSIGLLTEVLSLASPLAFGRANRIKALVQEMCGRLNVQNSWELVLAAMLSQVGCVSLPEPILRKIEHGEALSSEEQRIYQSCPRLGRELVSKIPRLGRIAELIGLHQHSYSQAQTAGQRSDHLDLAERAGFLKAAHDYDRLVQRGLRPEQAFSQMRQQEDVYPPDVLQVLGRIVERKRDHTIREIPLAELAEGMVLAGDIVNGDGVALLTKGNRVTKWLAERLRHQKVMGRPVQEPIRILHVEENARPSEKTAVSTASV